MIDIFISLFILIMLFVTIFGTIIALRQGGILDKMFPNYFWEKKK